VANAPRLEFFAHLSPKSEANRLPSDGGFRDNGELCGRFIRVGIALNFSI